MKAIYMYLKSTIMCVLGVIQNIFIVKKNDITRNLVNPEYLVLIAKTIDKSKCDIKFGLRDVKCHQSYNQFIKNRIQQEKKPVTMIKIINELNEDTCVRSMVMNHIFYTIGLDNKIWKYEIETYCSANIFEESMIQDMIEVASIYCDGIIHSNNINENVLYSLVVPDPYEINLVQEKNFKTTISCYGDLDDYVQTGELPEDNIQESEVYIPIKTKAPIYTFDHDKQSEVLNSEEIKAKMKRFRDSISTQESTNIEEDLPVITIDEMVENNMMLVDVIRKARAYGYNV